MIPCGILIKNGLVAGEGGAIRADIRIAQEKIDEVGLSLPALPNERIVDADGLYVLPGGVDIHTHMDLDLGNVRATDDFYTGTVAAACGGTTTIIDHMAFGAQGCSIHSQVERYHELADGKAVIDYGFHGVFDHVDNGILHEIEALTGDGITSHKFYLTYGGKISDAEVMRLFSYASGLGVLMCVHAENDGAIAFLRDKYAVSGETRPIGHALSRPPETEAEAIGRMLYFAGMCGSPNLYIVHLSSGLGLAEVTAARARGQKNIFAETCPQYLLLDDSCYLRPDGLKYIMSPPLRPHGNPDALWAGISGGHVDTVATDHCPFFYSKEKQLGNGDFRKTPGGAPGVEARIPLMFSQVINGRLSLGRLVSLCCANPARLAGIYPEKGVIAPGSSADILLIDPAREHTLTFDMLHENTDYTPYEGIRLYGYPVMTIARGAVVAAGGQFLGKRGYGRFLKRGLPDTAGIRV